jgi:clan AA aspartic protease
MVRVLVEARIENIKDAWEVETGQREPADARVVTVTDALVDTGATFLSLPSKLIKQLGLNKVRERTLRTAAGPKLTAMYDAVRLAIKDRACTVDVVEVDDDAPVLIGQLALEAMDWVVDPKGQRLIGNPAHGGEWQIEAYQCEIELYRCASDAGMDTERSSSAALR